MTWIPLKGVLFSGEPGKEVLIINPDAVYYAPLEFYLGPMPVLENGKPVDFTFYTEANKKYNWSLVSGKLPEGLTFTHGRLTGIPAKTGSFDLQLQLINGKEKILIIFT